MNWAGNVGGFLEAFKEGVQKGLGGLFGKEGTTLDGQPLVDGKDKNYMNLPWNVRKKFDESVGNQSSIFGLGGPGVDQASIFGLGGPGLPGEPGVPGVPSAPDDGRPLLPGEKPLPKIFAAQPFLDNFMISAFQRPPSYIKESMDRQRTGGPNYSIEDKKNIIDWAMKTRA